MNYECINHYKKTIMEDVTFTNEALTKSHPHYAMRHHPAWQDVTFACRNCGLIIMETDTGKCARCSAVKHEPLKPLKKIKKK